MKRKDLEFQRAALEDSLSLKANQDKEPPSFSKVRSLLVTALGGVLGMVLSVAVNSVLFEISASRLFAFYFGLIFSLIGSIILVRAWTQPTKLKRYGVMFFSIIVFAGGLCSLCFRSDWLWMKSPGKVFVYTILGVSTSFTVTFSWVDVVSFVHDFNSLPSTPTAPIFRVGLIESTEQVWMILALSVITGVTYGLIFGLVQLGEMSTAYHSREELLKSLSLSELFCLPFGFVLGMVFAAINEWLRYRAMIRALKEELEYKPLTQEVDDGI